MQASVYFYIITVQVPRTLNVVHEATFRGTVLVGDSETREQVVDRVIKSADEQFRSDNPNTVPDPLNITFFYLEPN